MLTHAYFTIIFNADKRTKRISSRFNHETFRNPEKKERE